MQFGTNGIRQRFNVLNPFSLVEVVRRLAPHLSHTVVVGHDHRMTSPSLYHALLSSLSALGKHVYALGLSSTPTTALYAESKGWDSIMVTASHNPPEWNGIKVNVKGVPVSKEHGARMLSTPPKNVVNWKDVGQIVYVDEAVNFHIQRLKQHLGFRSFDGTVLFDYGNGTAALFQSWFAQCVHGVHVNVAVDGTFPARKSEPKAEHLTHTLQLMNDAGIEWGFAWDGDADRVVLMHDGQLLGGDVTFAIGLLHLDHVFGVKGPVVSTIAATNVMKRAASLIGKELVMTKVGSPYIAERLLALNAQVGGEEVGNLVWRPHTLEKDGIFFATLLLDAIGSGRIYDYMKAVGKSDVVRYSVPSPVKYEVVKVLVEELKQQHDNVVAIDGVRVEFEDGWMLVRASGTEDIIRVMGEGRRANVVMKAVVKRIEELNAQLSSQ